MEERYKASRWCTFSKHVCNSENRLKGAGFTIGDIHRQYEQLEDVLQPFQLEEHLAIMKKFSRPDVNVYCFGDKSTETGSTISTSELRDTLENFKADLVVCRVDFDIVDKHITLKEKSLDILRHCLNSRPVETEILIDTEHRIHASEAKYIVFDALKEFGIYWPRKFGFYLPKTVHHAAETGLEDISVHRVISSIQDVRQVAESLENSFPEVRNIEVMTADVFDEHLNSRNVSEVANRISLTDGNKFIGRASTGEGLYQITSTYDAIVVPGEALYQNGWKVRQIKQQLQEKCSKAVADQIRGALNTKLKNHILEHMYQEIKKHSLVNLDDSTIRSKMLPAITASLDIPATNILILILGLLAAIFEVPYLLLVSFFLPVNVNDPAWRYNCVSGSVDRYQKNKKKIISDTVQSVHSHYQSVLWKLKKLKKLLHLPYIPDFGYNEAMFMNHWKIKGICSLEMRNEKLRKNVKKIIIGKSNGTLHANMYVKNKAKQIVKEQEWISLQQIGKSTNEDRNIQSFIIKNTPKMEPKMRNKIKEIISKETRRLFTLHSNLSIIKPSPIKSSNDGKSVDVRPCIVFVCLGKGFIPIGEPEFPKTLDGIDIDVREGFFTPFICHSCSVGQYSLQSACSYGFSVSRAGNPTEKGFITAAHGVVNEDVLCRDIAFQKQHIINTYEGVVAPSNCDSPSPKDHRKYGNVADIHFGNFSYRNKSVGIDAAFVKKQNGTQQDLTFHIPQGNLVAPIFDIENHFYSDVIKCGRKTSLTSGLVMSDGVACKYVDDLNNFVILENQYQINSNIPNTSFIKPGDSGSGVYLVQEGNHHPIGIAIASQHVDGKVCFVTPIKYILESLNLEMYPASMEM